MAKKISNQDLFENDFGKPLIDVFKDIQKEIDESIKGIRKFGSALKDEVKANKLETAEDVQKLSEARKKANKAIETESKLQKERIKILQQIEDAKTDEFEAVERLRAELNAQKKEIRDNIKAEKKYREEIEAAEGSLKKKRLELARLKKEFVEAAEPSQELINRINELTSEIKESEESIQVYSRNVGNYSNSVREALESTNLWGDSLASSIDKSGVLGEIIAKLNGVIAVLIKSVKAETVETVKNTAASNANEKQNKKSIFAMLGLSKAARVTSRSFRFLKGAIAATGIGALILALSSVAAFFKKTQDGADGLANKMDKLKGGFEEISGRMARLGGEAINQLSEGPGLMFDIISAKISGNDEELQKLLKRYKQVAERGAKVLSKETSNLAEATAEAAKRYAEIGDKIRQAEKDFIPLREEVARLTAEYEKQEEVEADSTKSFKERTAAIQAASILQSEAAEKNLELARRELEIQEELYKFQEERGTATVEDLEELSVKKIAFIEAEKEAELKRLNILKTARQLEQDLIEKNLDILIDGFDNQKTINEQLISDEERLFLERKKLLEETEELLKTSLAKEVQEIQKTSKAKIDINELLKESDSIVLNEKIRLLGLSEIMEGRLLEVIRDARTAQRDLDQQSIDLTRARADELERTVQSIEDLENELIEDKYKSSREKLKIEAERAIAELEIIKTRYEGEKEIVENVTKEIELIRKKLSKDLAEIDKQEKDEQDKKNKEEFDRKKAQYQKMAELTNEFFAEQGRARREQIDREIADSKRREDQLTQLAAGGSEEAQRSLALEQQRQSQLEQERRKSLRRQRQLAFGLAGAELIISNARQGSSDPAGKSLEQLSAFASGVSDIFKNLPAFETGGKVKGGEQIVRINEKGEEFVVKHSAVEKYGDKMLNDINNGTFDAFNYVQTPSGIVHQNFTTDFSDLKKEFESLRAEIKNKPVPYIAISEVTGGLKKTIQEGNKFTTQHFRKSNLF